MRQGKVLFAGCARNCAAALPGVLKNVEAMASLWEDSAFLFVENDSTDGTKAILQAWCGARDKARMLSFDGLAEFCPVRTVRLERLRKQCLSVLRAEYADYTHLVLLDCDEVNIGEMDMDAVRRAVDFLNADPATAGVFAGQDDLYYDLWALRHPTLCPGDIWEEVYDYALMHRVTDAEAFRNTFVKRLFPLPASAPPLEVDSAFGGLGIYKIASVLGNARSYAGYKIKRVPVNGEWWEVGWQVCEHVAFHAGFRERNEKLFILPFLVNAGPPRIDADAAAGGRSQTPSRPKKWRRVDPDPSTYGNLVFNLGLVRPDIAASAGHLCPCGSGKLYRQCHGAVVMPPAPASLRDILAL